MTIQSFLEGLTWEPAQPARPLPKPPSHPTSIFRWGGGEKSRREYMHALSSAGPATGSISYWDAASGDKAGMIGGKDKRYAPLVYAALLKDATKPGGVLSDLYTQRKYGEFVGGIWDQYGQGMQEQMGSLQRFGANPITIQRILARERGKTQENIGRGVAGMRGELEENRFGAMQALANLIAQTERENVSLDWARELQSRQEKLAREAGRNDLFGSFIGAGATIASGLF